MKECKLSKDYLTNATIGNRPKYASDYFDKIDTKEKAYILGFLIADGSVDTRGHINCKIQIKDSEILEFISEKVGCHVTYNYYLNKQQKRFPYASISICDKNLCNKFRMLCGGRLKEERRLPRVKKDLELFMLQGFFDADGCITWGKRKDRDRYWCKICFNSQLTMLNSIQKILINNNIATTIRPKSGDGCFVLEFSNHAIVLEALRLIYSDESFVVLKRKYEKAVALRLELDENGESQKCKNIGRYRAKPPEAEGVETSGGCASSLNNHISIQA